MAENTELLHRIQIAASPDRVWQLLADLEAVRNYNPAVRSAVVISEARDGIGAARECEVAEGRLRERVTGWDPGSAVEMELYESPWPIRFMRWRTELHPNRAGTEVRQTLSYQPKFGVFGALLNRLLIKNKLDTSLHRVFERMKQYLEGEAASSRD